MTIRSSRSNRPGAHSRRPPAWFLAAAGTLLCAMAPALALGNERNGVAVVAGGPDRTGYLRELRRLIQESGRFQLVQPAPTGFHLRMPGVFPDPPFSEKVRWEDGKKLVAWRNAVKARTTARWLFFTSIAYQKETISEFGSLVATTSMEISGRAFDLDLGDYSQLMAVSGRDPGELAAQTLKYLRVAYPLQGLVTAIREGTVYLDLGRKNGVDRGSWFVVRRKVGAFNEKVATVVVTSSSDWYAVAEVEEMVLHKKVQAGDAAVEDTSALLASP